MTRFIRIGQVVANSDLKGPYGPSLPGLARCLQILGKRGYAPRMSLFLSRICSESTSFISVHALITFGFEML